MCCRRQRSRPAKPSESWSTSCDSFLVTARAPPARPPLTQRGEGLAVPKVQWNPTIQFAFLSEKINEHSFCNQKYRRERPRAPTPGKQVDWDHENSGDLTNSRHARLGRPRHDTRIGRGVRDQHGGLSDSRRNQVTRNVSQYAGATRGA